MAKSQHSEWSTWSAPLFQKERNANLDRRRATSVDRPWSWKIGEVSGIGIYAHGTFVLLLVWIGFAYLFEGHGVAEALSGVALILSIFGIVVLHELSHALTAKRFGVRTLDITLWPIGGVARLERMPEKPVQELLIALSGPAVNIAVALLLYGLIVSLHGPLGIENLRIVRGAFLTKLMWINVSLAVFNLLPAFPMDGGRVLRAALAFRLDYVRATTVAARLGKVMAVVFGSLGFIVNPMLLFIAFVVWMGAQQEATSVRWRALLREIPAHTAMVTDFHALHVHESLARAVELIRSGFQQDFPVVNRQGSIVGLLTREGILARAASLGIDSTVGDAMHANVGIISPLDTLDEALTKLQHHAGHAVVVAHEGQPVGLVTATMIGERLVERESPALSGVHESST